MGSQFHTKKNIFKKNVNKWLKGSNVYVVGVIAQSCVTLLVQGVSSAMMHGLLVQACNFLCLYLVDLNKNAVLQMRSVGRS
jgi:hypothetical protein